jgi:hypothetical protein
MSASTEYRAQTRAALKWWRANNPEKSKHVKVISHGWYGHVLWTTEGDAGVLMSVEDVRKAYAAATGV